MPVEGLGSVCNAHEVDMVKGDHFVVEELRPGIVSGVLVANRLVLDRRVDHDESLWVPPELLILIVGVHDGARRVQKRHVYLGNKGRVVAVSRFHWEQGQVTVDLLLLRFDKQLGAEGPKLLHCKLGHVGPCDVDIEIRLAAGQGRRRVVGLVLVVELVRLKLEPSRAILAVLVLVSRLDIGVVDFVYVVVGHLNQLALDFVALGAADLFVIVGRLGAAVVLPSPCCHHSALLR